MFRTGLLLPAPPPWIVRPFIDAAVVVLAQRHRGLMERLGTLCGTTFLVDPADWPLRFVLQIGRGRIRLRVATRRETVAADATIRGSMYDLVDLLEGRVDGDALFFSRKLSITGNTEAVVTLRNLVDGEGIDLVADLLAPLGGLARPSGEFLRRLAGFRTRPTADVRHARSSAADLGMASPVAPPSHWIGISDKERRGEKPAEGHRSPERRDDASCRTEP